MELAADYAEALVAWRTWALADEGRGWRLQSVVKSTVWSPCRPLEAECLRPRPLRRFRRHHVPEFDCACGVYASELPVAASYLDSSWLGLGGRRVRQVLGRVSLWGEVVVCERGYRASLAYPAHLYVAGRDGRGEVRDDAFDVAAGLEAYGVPVSLVDLDEAGLLRALAAQPQRA